MTELCKDCRWKQPRHLSDTEGPPCAVFVAPTLLAACRICGGRRWEASPAAALPQQTGIACGGYVVRLVHHPARHDGERAVRILENRSGWSIDIPEGVVDAIFDAARCILAAPET